MSRGQLVDDRQPDGVGATDPFWSRLREVIRALNGSPLVGGRLITADDGKLDGTGVAFTAGQTKRIAHKLGRRAKGFLEVAGAELEGEGGLVLKAGTMPPNMTTDHYISVTATNAGRCFIWVF